MTHDAPSIAILAAGASRRMGGADKLLQTLAGAPLLRVVAMRAAMTGHEVRIALPRDSAGRRQVLAGLPVETIDVPDAAHGMSASFRAIGAVATGPVMIVLADMPDIRSEHLRALLTAHRENPERVIRAVSEGGQAGQPVVFPARLVAPFQYLQGDSGAKALLSGEDIVAVPMPGHAATTDLDTPEAWADWRARTGMPL